MGFVCTRHPGAPAGAGTAHPYTAPVITRNTRFDVLAYSLYGFTVDAIWIV
jgi:hypothetical protein